MTVNSNRIFLMPSSDKVKRTFLKTNSLAIPSRNKFQGYQNVKIEYCLAMPSRGKAILKHLFQKNVLPLSSRKKFKAIRTFKKMNIALR